MSFHIPEFDNMYKSILLIFLAVFALNSYAAIPGWMWWDGGGSDDLWTTGDNWRRDDGQYPDNTAPNADCNVSLGYFSAYSPAYAEITEEMDITIYGFSIGNRGEGTLEMFGGTLNAYYMNNTQNLSTAKATLNMYGGAINIETSIGVARDGAGVINLEGGTITCKLLMMALNTTGVGTINLRGGELIVNYDRSNPQQNNLNIRAGSKIDITGGTLKYEIGGLYTANDFYDMASAGKITAYGNSPGTSLNITGQGGYLVISAQACSDLPETVFVAPGGSDENCGTIFSPLATFTAARNMVRQIRAEEPNRDITVFFRGGTYFFDETVVLDYRDTAPEGCKTVFAAYNGEEPVFSSGYNVTGWQKLTVENEPDYLPETASGNIWAAPIPSAVGGLFKSMYDGQSELPRARSEGFKPVVGPNDPGIHDFGYSELHYPEGTVFRQWANMSDIEILIRPRVLWMMNILPLESVDTVNRIAHVAVDAVYPMNDERYYRFPEEGSVWIENAVDCLDSPGEWVVDTTAGMIYYWPQSGTPSNEIYIPLLKEFIRVEGREDFAAPAPVQGIVFDGLTFTCGERDSWVDGEAVIQHGWESYNKDNAMLRFWWSQNCKVTNCRFENSSGTGVRFDFYSIANKVYNNTFAHLGQSGVVISGYGPGIRNLSRENRIIKNEIYDCGRQYWHSHGIILFQTGYNVVSHNRIYDMPYTGITLTAIGEQFFTEWGLRQNEMSATIRWDEVHVNPYDYTGINGDSPTFGEIERYLFTRNNVVEYNEINDVMRVLGDGNAIYLRYCPRGNQIRRNFIHNIVGEHIHGGIRCDGGQAEVTVKENIIYKCVRKGIVFSERNYVNNNIIACLYEQDDPANIYGVGLDGYIEIMDGAQDSQINNNIFYHCGAKAADYLREYAGADILEYCQSQNNIFFDEQNPARAQSYLASLPGQSGSLAADPLFADIANANLNLSAGSPAYVLGFKEIKFDAMGLYWQWDLNYNGTVGLDDVVYLSQRWLQDDCFIDMKEELAKSDCFVDYTVFAEWIANYNETSNIWE
jgi:hypothetical protein